MRVKEESEKEAWNITKNLRSWHLVSSLHGKWKGKKWKQWQILFWGGSKITMMVTTAMKLKDTCFLEGKLDSIVKSRDITMPTKVHIVKAMIFLVVMYGCESWTIKEGWALKSWCFRMVVLEKKTTLESPLDSKEIKPVNPKGNQPWIFIVMTDTPILWPPDRKSWLIVKESSWCWERVKAKGEGHGNRWEG